MLEPGKWMSIVAKLEKINLWTVTHLSIMVTHVFAMESIILGSLTSPCKFAWRMEDYNSEWVLHLAGYSALLQEQLATQPRTPWCAKQKLPFPGSLMTISFCCHDNIPSPGHPVFTVGGNPGTKHYWYLISALSDICRSMLISSVTSLNPQQGPFILRGLQTIWTCLGEFQ